MKKHLFSTLAIFLLGFSLLSAQKPDSVYHIGAVGIPVDATSTDLNNDGNPDLVFITYSADSVITMLGNGLGAFTSRSAVHVSTANVSMIALDVADFNNDGFMDVVAASTGSGAHLIILGGNGNGTLTYTAFGPGGNSAYDIVTGNFDAYSGPNLNADLALSLLTPSGNDTVLYYIGNGTLFFGSTLKVPTGGGDPNFLTKLTEPGTLPALDHVVVSNFSSNNVGIILSNGNGTFQPVLNIPVRAVNPSGIAWDFFNNDNLPDLAYTGYNSDSLFVQMGTAGLTSYGAAVSYPVGNSPFGLAGGDFTGDGHADLASVGLNNDSASFVVNNGSGGFRPTIKAYTGISDGRNATAADINNNGLPDLLVGSNNPNVLGVFNLKSPTVSPVSLTGNPPSGAPFTLPVITARDTTNIASVELMYRQVGKTAYTSLPLTAGAGTPTQRSYSGTLPAGAMTNRGLEYFFRTSDGFVTASVEPTTNLFPFRRLRTSIAENAPATLNRSYQMVSFPFGFTSAANGSASIQIADDFSLSDPNSARLFWWDPVKADTITTDTTSLNGYREFGSSGFPNFTPGLSMFLATVGSKTYDANLGLSTSINFLSWRPTPSGDSVLVEYYSSTLDSGWNMIATPFAFTIHLDSVDVIVPDVDNDLHEVTDPIRDNRIGLGGANLRERTASGYIVPNPPLLKPWRGYFLKNNGPEQVFLYYPKQDGNFPLTAPPAPKAIAAGLDWKIDISARSGELEVPPTTLGTSKSALKDYDRLDWELPPALTGDLRVAFQRGKEFGQAGDYLTDIRPTLVESESWSFTVQPGESRAIELSFDGLADISQDYDVILSDVEGRAKQNLRTEPVYRFIASNDRHFELTVTPKTTGQAVLMPTKYDLHQNFPNPFNPQTLIKYDLPEEALVRLEVFNILGQKVATLVDRHEAAGPKSVVWNGTDAKGAKVSSGIYFYKIAAGDYSAARKMTLMK